MVAVTTATPVAHPDHASPPRKPSFAVGVVAPLDYDPPGLDLFVRNRLRQLLTYKRTTHSVYFHSPFGQPVSRIVTVLAHEWKTQNGGLGGGNKLGRYVEHLRACCHVASFSDAVVVFHGGAELPADLKRLLGVCEWLRTATRVFMFAGNAVPL